MTDNEQLEPCPFCGSGNVKRSAEVEWHSVMVECDECDASAPLDVWNKRATIDKHEKAREFWADLSVHLAQNQAYAGRIPDYVERLATRRHPMIVEAQAVAVAETAALYRQQLATLKAQPSGVDERTAFEAEFRKRGHLINRIESGDIFCYDTAGMQSAWTGWQARAALTTPAQNQQRSS